MCFAVIRAHFRVSRFDSVLGPAVINHNRESDAYDSVYGRVVYYIRGACDFVLYWIVMAEVRTLS